MKALKKSDVESILKNVNDSQEGFLPLRYFSVIADNEFADSEKFDIEIEKSEIDYAQKAVDEHHIKEFFIDGKGPKNSMKWLNNHKLKPGKVIIPFSKLLECRSFTEDEKDKRDFASEKNISLFENYIEDMNNKGFQVYSIF